MTLRDWNTHHVFLAWLLYSVTVALTGLGLLYLDIPQRAVLADQSYLTLLLLVLYGAAEALSARQAWRISQAMRLISDLQAWLQRHPLTGLQCATTDQSVVLLSDTALYHLPASAIAGHVRALRAIASGGRAVDQRLLVEVLAERLYAPVTVIECIAGRIVWIGILATILGVILAFWPLLGSGMAIDTIRAKLGLFFAGIAVAFIPTAASFVFKIALDSGGKILTAGIAEVINRVVQTSATAIIPLLDRTADDRHGR